MAATIVHRGPDDYGYLLLNSRDGRFSLGQNAAADTPCDVLLASRRLSIIDTSSAGRQPMCNANRDIFLAYNGEIYNYLEIRRELTRKGRQFSSDTDTEVILHAYEEWGMACVERFNGMWAFVIWDQRTCRLFCSRDRFGAKPFYYFLSDDALIFGSEIKAILPALQAKPTPNLAVIHDYLARNQLCHTADTFFDGIQRLDAAHNLVVSADHVERTRYWDYTSRSHNYNFNEPEQTFRELFDDAVRLRLRSDVPVGIALSGGVDSTAVTAFAHRHAGDGLKAFTAEFPGHPFDEKRYAELVAERFGAELHTIEYRPDNLIDDLYRVVWHMDYPSKEPQVLPRWQLMNLAAGHVKVILEGQGSDEMLAGYLGRYFPYYLADELCNLKLRELPRVARKLGIAALRRYPYVGLGPLRKWVERVLPFIKRFRRASHRVRVLSERFRNDASSLPPEYPSSFAPFADRLTRRLYLDHSRDILPYLLKFGDAISMACSLEARLPFLDYRLVEFVFGLPYSLKFDGTSSKTILKRAFADVLPPEILARKDKVGFNTPVSLWLQTCMDSAVLPLLLSERALSRGIFDPAQLRIALTEHANGKAHIGALVLNWLSLEIWFRLFIDGDKLVTEKRVA